MKSNLSKIAICTLFVVLSQPVLSVQVRNQISPALANVGVPGVIERGGTVEVVDFGKKFMVVDGNRYTLNAIKMDIHAQPGEANGKNNTLKPGMKIRFNTSKNNYAAQEQVIEVWVTVVAKKSTK